MTEKIVQPFTGEWFRTVSFGDAIKLLVLMCAMVVGYQSLHDKVDHLDATVREITDTSREMRREDNAIWDRRFTELVARDDGQRADLTRQIERLADRLDNLQPRKQ